MYNCDCIKCHKEEIPSITEEFNKRLWLDVGMGVLTPRKWEVEQAKARERGGVHQKSKLPSLYGFGLCKPCPLSACFCPRKMSQHFIAGARVLRRQWAARWETGLPEN